MLAWQVLRTPQLGPWIRIDHGDLFDIYEALLFTLCQPEGQYVIVKPPDATDTFRVVNLAVDRYIPPFAETGESSLKIPFRSSYS